MSAIPVGAELLEDRQLLSAVVPPLASSPDAPVTIYLDFDGHNEAQWGKAGEEFVAPTPVFDVDNNPNSFSLQEQQLISDIWSQVAEDYSVFTVNVTTIAPPSIGNTNAEAPNVLRVAIGGSAYDWYKNANESGVSGVAMNDSFFNEDLVSTVFVFSDDLMPTADRIAHAIGHESGHAFGLDHQSKWSELIFQGKTYDIKLDEYYDGNGVLSPLMGGFDPNAERTVWWVGSSSHGPNKIQNDVSTMWSNGLGDTGGSFDFRPDDHPNQIADQPIIPHTGALTIEGVISPYTFFKYGTSNGSQQPTQDPDKDFFAVSLPGIAGLGQWDVEVNVADVGPNLDARIEVYDFNGNLVATADPGNSLDANLSLSSGNYWIAVMGHNHPGISGSDPNYLDMGTYTLTIEFTEPYFEEFILPKYPFTFLEDPYRFSDPIEEIAGRTVINTRLLVNDSYEALSSDALTTSLLDVQESAIRSGDAEQTGTRTTTKELSATIDAVFTKGLEELLVSGLQEDAVKR